MQLPAPPVARWLQSAERWAHHPWCTVLLWLLTCGTAAGLLYFSWHSFDDPPTYPPERCRADGNCGHTHIDFGGQWVLGRMVAAGFGRSLYHRQKQWLVVQAGFSPENEPPLIREQVLLPAHLRTNLEPDDDIRHDAEKLMSWFMGQDSPAWSHVGSAVGVVMAAGPSPAVLWQPILLHVATETVSPVLIAELERPAIGGPLYPPVHALLYAPLGFLPPQLAYRLFQMLSLLVVFVAALAVKLLTNGRIPWSVAALGLFFYPGTRAALDLGQNPTLTLAILLWGWLAFARGREIAAGCLWGCLAFKPVWALAFLLVPLVMGRWKFLLAMIATGGAWVLATLPLVGIHSWWDWLQVGRMANALYCVNDNWIHLSRDLHGIPRRLLHDFSVPAEQRDTPLAQFLAWTLWGTVLLLTVMIYRWRAGPPRHSGIAAAFLLLGAWLCCYRFMYYDVLLTALPITALLADPRRWLAARPIFLLPLESPATGVPSIQAASPDKPRFWVYVNSFPLTILAFLYLLENALRELNLQATFAIGYHAAVTTEADGTTAVCAPSLKIATGLRYPWDTVLVFLLWAWCGVQLLLGRDRSDEARQAAAHRTEMLPRRENDA